MQTATRRSAGANINTSKPAQVTRNGNNEKMLAGGRTHRPDQIFDVGDGAPINFQSLENLRIENSNDWK
jgi:hypothetical protein